MRYQELCKGLKGFLYDIKNGSILKKRYKTKIASTLFGCSVMCGLMHCQGDTEQYLGLQQSMGTPLNTEKGVPTVCCSPR